MTNDEIAKLAKEYAEEIYPNLSDKIISLRTQEIKNAERLIRFLLRTHCIVSKEKVEEIKENRYLKEYEFLTERCFEDLNPENRDWHDISRLCDGIYYALKKLLDDTLTEE